MDINIAFLNPQTDASLSNPQYIENKQDFLVVIEKQISSLKEEAVISDKMNTDLNLILKSEVDELSSKLEKNILLSGNKFPPKEDSIKKMKNNIDQSLEKNDGSDVIYSVFFNPPVSHADEAESKVNYLMTTNVIQIDSESENHNKENIQLQSKKEININSLPQSNIKNDIVYEDLGQILAVKTEKPFNFTSENKFIDNEDMILSEDNKIDTVLTSLIPSDLSLEGKSKNKIQSQLSAYENLSEFNDTSMIDNEYTQVDSNQIIQESEINYDSNKAQSFEKELGEHLVSMIKENNHQVKLKVNPPELGSIDIDLNWADEQANVSFYSGNPQVVSAIESSIAELKNLFHNQNLSLGDVHVFHQHSDDSKKHHHTFSEAQKENIHSNKIDKSEKENNHKPLSSGNISVFV